MKTALSVIFSLLLGGNVYAQSFTVLNPIVGQGDVLIVQIAAQWMPPATSNPTIYIFGSNHRPNDKGRVYIGIGMGTLPGKYILTFNENGLRSGWYYEEMVVLETSFEKTRLSYYTEQPSQRTDRQYTKIQKIFADNKSGPDLTGGLGYSDPLSLARDISDPFGPIYSNNPYRKHGGIDLRAPVGTPVRAINSGKVVLVAKKFRAEGNMLIVSHGLGIFSVYMHLSKFTVKEGDLVKQGQTIALSGRSGAGVREPHLHLSLRINDIYVDPLKFIDSANSYLK